MNKSSKFRKEKRKPIKVSKKKILEYNSDDSSSSHGEKDKREFKKLSAKEMQELDIETAGRGGQNRSSDEDSYDEEAWMEEGEEGLQDSVVKKSKKNSSEALPEKSLEQVEQQRASKLGSVISKILDNSKANENRPVLSLKRKIEAEIDDAKLEAKAKKLLTAEKKQKKDKGKVIPSHATTDYEKSLKKLATRGVVQLFNALRAAQKSAQDLEMEGIQKHVNEVPTVSKQAFLDTLKKESAKKPIGGPIKVQPSCTGAAESAVPFLRDDYTTKDATKHWDQD